MQSTSDLLIFMLKPCRSVTLHLHQCVTPPNWADMRFIGSSNQKTLFNNIEGKRTEALTYRDAPILNLDLMHQALILISDDIVCKGKLVSRVGWEAGAGVEVVVVLTMVNKINQS